MCRYFQNSTSRVFFLSYIYTHYPILKCNTHDFIIPIYLTHERVCEFFVEYFQRQMHVYRGRVYDSHPPKNNREPHIRFLYHLNLRFSMSIQSYMQSIPFFCLFSSYKHIQTRTCVLFISFCLAYSGAA